ncbi:A disintegrin and metalloproteinase with thrombospondin motifs 9 isoform X2 [Scaptodrosophila lebanonensis]|nr:A disintegrin and metalloproteinase with thrombospondin motifs 9 isoform X2 [Scaptodrosophila lebanonensis]
MSTHWKHNVCLILTVPALCLFGALIFFIGSGSSGGYNSKYTIAPPKLPPLHFIESTELFINDTNVIDWGDDDNMGGEITLEDIGDDNHSDLVTPIKIANSSLNADDLLYESKRNSDGNSSQKDSAFSRTGTFRSKSSQIWDPHPEYILKVFGRALHLVLHQDTSFIPTDTFRVIRILNNDIEETDTQEQGHYLGCIYKGHVEGDQHSDVAVSLCGGMTGYIKTGFGTLLIQPVNQSSSNDDAVASGGDNQILHRVWRRSQRNARHAVSDFELDLEALELMATRATSKRTRRKRHNTDNQVYTLEVLVAVDRTMAEFHKNKNSLYSYILILFSIVSNIFADASIGNSIHISLVKLLEIRDPRPGNSTAELLKHFCSHLPQYGYHYDTAMLITRKNICGEHNPAKCHTLGLAELGTVCNPRSCSIVQDNGLSAAFTIAHELGHILNMPHDDDKRCIPHNHRDSIKHIMAPSMGEHMHPWSWSKCSQHYVSEFLEKSDKSCLEDTPTSYISNVPTQLPGEIYSLDHQCQLIHGSQSYFCNIDVECTQLWCKSNLHSGESCSTGHLPWADGTPCNHNRHWCQRGNCVPRNGSTVESVNGGWGPWSSYTVCSLTCGGGVQESRRECNNPLPKNGGKYCVGSRKKYRSCNTQSCPPGTTDLREEQCYNMNGRNFNIPGISPSSKWIPKYGLSVQDKCKLYCRMEDNSAYFQLSDKVRDGTTCSIDSFDKCVNGICRPAGCDNELNSIAKLDKCGVCEGRNDTCEERTGNFYVSDLFKQAKPASRCFYVTTIPKGASNIVITQPGYPEHNYIALSDDRRHPLLNSDNLVIPFRKKDHYAGLTFEYNGSNSTIERINTTYSRKLKRDLIVEIISIDLSAAKNNDTILITYTYTLDKPNYVEPEEEIYRWEMQTWSNCDSLCDGSRYRSPACVSITQGLKVAPQFCDESAKPGMETGACNTECSLNLNISKTKCSAACGQLGKWEMAYKCMQTFRGIQHTNIVDMSYCDLKPELMALKVLNEECVGPCWAYTDWSTCTKTCGTGTQVRKTKGCYIKNTPTKDEFCDQRDLQQNLLRTCNIEPCYYIEGTGLQQNLLRTCNKEPCYYIEGLKNPRSVNYWVASEWGKCNDWCEKSRTVTCMHPQGLGCPPEKKPQEVRKCCQIKYMNEWTPCSAVCGTGERRRMQYCARVYKSEVRGAPKMRVKIDNSYCISRNIKKPTFKKMKKSCKMTCKWAMSEWTQCATDCSEDYQVRHVGCETGHGIRIDERYCDATRRPLKRRICSNCVRRKSKVVMKCNCKGIERRRIFCFDSMDRRIVCPHKERSTEHQCSPPSGCNKPQSCADVQQIQRSYKDGEYILYVRSRPVRIYCHKMNSRTPKEYINLNQLENYSIYYEYRSHYPDSCPPESRASEFHEIQNSGRTHFGKLRLNITDLRVIENDFEFATTSGEQRQVYGSAGDCYNRNMACPQGAFSINLEHTGFVMRPGATWKLFGNSVVMRRDNGFETAKVKRRAFCGGYCGHCSISPSSGLYLDVL